MQEQDLGEKADRYEGFRDEKGRLRPGHKGGPGRKKGSVSIVRRVRKILAQNPEKLDQIAQNLVNQAAEGKKDALGFLKEIMDRIDGPVQRDVKLNLPTVEEGIELRERPDVSRN